MGGIIGVSCEWSDSQKHKAFRPESPFDSGLSFLPEQFVEEAAALLFFLVILDELSPMLRERLFSASRAGDALAARPRFH